MSASAGTPRTTTGGRRPPLLDGRRPPAASIRVIDGAAQDIVAKGEYSLTESYLPDAVDGCRAGRASRSSARVTDFKHGDVDGAVSHARRAVDFDPDSSIALVNLASLAYNMGDFDLSMDMARRLAETTSDPGMRAIADALVAILEDSLDGNIRDLLDLLRATC